MLKRVHEFDQEPSSRGKHLSLWFQIEQMLKCFARLGPVSARGTLLCSVLHGAPAAARRDAPGREGWVTSPESLHSLHTSWVVASVHSCVTTVSKGPAKSHPKCFFLI